MEVLHNLNFKNCGPVFATVTEFPASPDVGLTVLKDGIIYTYTVIQGVYSWYPLSNKVNSYVQTQGVASTTWTINHGLNNDNILFFVYDDNHNLVEPGFTYI